MRNPDQGLNLRAEMAKAAGLIRSTAEGQSRQTDRSKWSRVMRYAAAYKPDWEPLDQFISGINACAAQFSRRLGRGKPFANGTAGYLARADGRRRIRAATWHHRDACQTDIIRIGPGSPAAKICRRNGRSSHSIAGLCPATFGPGQTPMPVRRRPQIGALNPYKQAISLHRCEDQKVACAIRN
jgi:hypothetical protein